MFAPSVLTGPAGPGPPGFQQLPSRVAGHKLPVCTEIMSSMVWGVKTSLLLMNSGENARWQLVFNFLILQNKDVPLCWSVPRTAGGAQAGRRTACAGVRRRALGGGTTQCQARPGSQRIERGICRARGAGDGPAAEGSVPTREWLLCPGLSCSSTKTPVAWICVPDDDSEESSVKGESEPDSVGHRRLPGAEARDRVVFPESSLHEQLWGVWALGLAAPWGR